MYFVLEIIIKESEAGLSIKELLTRLKLSARLITKLKNKPKGITVNGEKKTVRYILEKKDVLTLETEDSVSSSTIKPSYIPINVLFEDDYFLAVEKGANLPIHPSRNHIDDTLASRVMAHFEGQNFVFRVLTRLDRDTSGIVLIAKNAIAAAEFSKLLAKREVKKEYLAVCVGIFDKKEGQIDYNIRRISPYNIMREAVKKSESKGENSPEGMESLSLYKVLKESENHSLVLLLPVSGRTHQLRVHCLKIGHPIVGDGLYYKESPYIERQALHAYSLTFIHPFTNKEITLKCPLSEDIKDLISHFSLE